MANLNKVMLIGNMTRDAELRYTPKGTAVADIGLAINRKSKDANGELREEVVFVDVTLWGKTAENVNQYVGKGSPLFVEGRLQLDQWEDNQTGQKRSKLKVVGDFVQFLGGPKEGQGQGQRSDPAPSQGSGSGRPAPSNQSVPSNRPGGAYGEEDPDDDIPF